MISEISSCDAIIICPSNPFVSIDPILSLKEIKNILKEKYVLAVSPLIGGKAIKGPLAKIFNELNIEPSVGAIAEHYHEILNCLFIDEIDRNEIPLNKQSSIIFEVTNIFLPDLQSRIKLADEIIGFLIKNQK